MAINQIKTPYAQTKKTVDILSIFLRDATIKITDWNLVNQQFYLSHASFESVLEFYAKSNPLQKALASCRWFGREWQGIYLCTSSIQMSCSLGMKQITTVAALSVSIF